MGQNVFQTAVEVSRKFNAREAGQDVAKKTLDKLEHSPNFILLFSTIHYENHGGFQELLNGVWDVLPENIPLVGGTVAGFMNQHGCFTRGVAILATYSEDIDVQIGVGHNTKRNPNKAVNDCFSHFKKIDDTKNQLFIEIVSGAIIPKFPRIGRQSVIKSKSAGETSIKLLPLISHLNMGADRADEILDLIVNRFPKSKLIGITCMDDRKFIKSYQFINGKVLENALCVMKLSGNFKYEMKTSFGLVEKEGDPISLELNPDKRLVQKINGKKATQELLEIVGIDQDNVRMLDRFYSQSFYYPFGHYENKFIHACIVSGILGEKVYFANQTSESNLKLFQLTGKQIFESAEALFDSLNNSLNMNFLVMCETYIETLGGQIYKVFDIIKNRINNPFLVLFVGGESVSYGDGVPHYLYESLNSLAVDTNG